MSFKKFMQEVDQLCIKTLNMSVYCFEDHPWRSNYEDEMDPGTALYYMLEENGYVQRYPDLLLQFAEESRIV
jgi:hypothetical protein